MGETRPPLVLLLSVPQDFGHFGGMKNGTLVAQNEITLQNKIKASEMLVAPRISEYFLKSLKF